jgi:hypothetical protein
MFDHVAQGRESLDREAFAAMLTEMGQQQRIFSVSNINMPPKCSPDGPFGFVERRTPRGNYGDKNTLRGHRLRR